MKGKMCFLILILAAIPGAILAQEPGDVDPPATPPLRPLTAEPVVTPVTPASSWVVPFFMDHEGLAFTTIVTTNTSSSRASVTITFHDLDGNELADASRHVAPGTVWITTTESGGGLPLDAGEGWVSIHSDQPVVVASFGRNLAGGGLDLFNLPTYEVD